MIERLLSSNKIMERLSSIKVQNMELDNLDDQVLPVFTHKGRIKTGFTLVPSGLSGMMQGQTDATIACETFIRLLSYILLFLTFPFSLMFCFKVIAQYERAVTFRLGKLTSNRARGPGLIFLIPCLDTYRIVDLRTYTFDVPTQEVLTKDSVTVAVNAVVYYRVHDPVNAVVNVEDANRSTRLIGQTTLRNVLGTVTLDKLLAAREEIAFLMQGYLDNATESWGVTVERVEIKDVRLPYLLQRAMAAEAEAAREAAAQIITAEGEKKASSVLKLAAREIIDYPVALQLRYLQTMKAISLSNKSTIIFPFPFEMENLLDNMIREIQEQSSL